MKRATNRRADNVDEHAEPQRSWGRKYFDDELCPTLREALGSFAEVVGVPTALVVDHETVWTGGPEGVRSLCSTIRKHEWGEERCKKENNELSRAASSSSSSVVSRRCFMGVE